MRCPKGFIQKPPKSGNCVAKTASVKKTASVRQTASVKQTRKRCPKGFRKDKSGDCHKIDKENLIKRKSNSIPKSSIMIAKFYNVANDIFPGYNEKGYIVRKYNKTNTQVKEKVQKYLDKQTNINPGDILYVGSTSDSRQYENAYVIVNNERKALGYRDSAVYLPSLYRDQIPEKISYKAMLDEEFDKVSGASLDDEAYGFGMDFFGAADGDINQARKDVIDELDAKGIY
jgi:hypothetical protein